MFRGAVLSITAGVLNIIPDLSGISGASTTAKVFKTIGKIFNPVSKLKYKILFEGAKAAPGAAVRQFLDYADAKCGRYHRNGGMGVQSSGKVGGEMFGLVTKTKSKAKTLYHFITQSAAVMHTDADDSSVAKTTLNDPDAGDYFVIRCAGPHPFQFLPNSRPITPPLFLSLSLSLSHTHTHTHARAFVYFVRVCPVCVNGRGGAQPPWLWPLSFSRGVS